MMLTQSHPLRSSSTIAIKDKNGSFVSTLSMSLYKDAEYTLPLVIPPLGVELRTNIFVEVAAFNLSAQYFVLLDRCYASVSPHPTNSTFFNLFVSCSIDQLTTMGENGESQRARFSFKAFRFIEQQNETVSTYYIHCITRLCERSTCSTFKQCNNRKRRDLSSVVQDSVTESSVLTVAIKAKSEDYTVEDGLTIEQSADQSAAVGLGVAVAVLIVVGVAAMLLATYFYKKLS